MKIAVCFSGNLRHFKKCYYTFKECVLDASDHDFDVFTRTWDSRIQHFKEHFEDDGTLEEMVSLYKPKLIESEIYNEEKREELYKATGMDFFQKKIQALTNCEQRGFHYGDKCTICGGKYLHSFIGQIYNIWKANSLRKKYEEENNVKYDLVIRTRFDNHFFEKLTDDKIQKMTNGSVWIPYGYDSYKKFGGGPNDQMAIGTGKVMDVYSKMYENTLKIFEQNKKCVSPHKMIEDIFMENNMPIERFWLKYVLFKRLDAYNKRTKNITDEEYKNLRL